MAAEQRVLKQDGYLDVGNVEESRNIAYHPHLNVILVFDSSNQVKILDVHSGVILQTYNLGGNDIDKNVCGKYMPLQEKVLLWDGQNLGFRGDYNGVLLLDTILQPPILQNDDLIKLELLLSEAIIFQSCLKDLEHEGLECPSDVSNELLEKIKNAQANAKKGIKAQRWNTICLEVSYSSLKLVANNVVIMLKRLERHIPALAIASAINERLTDLLAGSRIPDLSWHGSNFQRVLMHSEAVRRHTFEKWPHMDYKWALPDQMAQAGFYHQPSSSGEDRAMCFTCSVCLVCWEKTDEPWSEHERHSPMCPFVKGEYTQNVPLSVTYATNPAVPTPGLGFDVISNSDYSNVLCTSCTQTGEITVWSIERHLKKMHSFNIASLMKDICDEGYEWAHVTAICVLPNARAQCKINAITATQSGGGGSGSGGGIVNTNMTGSGLVQCSSTSTLRAGVVGSKIVLGMSIRQNTGEYLLRVVVLNIVESDRVQEKAGGGGIGTGSSSGNTIVNGNSNIGISQKPQLVGATNGDNGGGGGDSNNSEKLSDKYDQRDDDNKSLSSVFEKYADGFDSNGFVSELIALKKGDCVLGDKSDTSALNDLLENELTKMDQLCDLSDISQLLEKTNDGGSGTGIGVGVGVESDVSINVNDIEMDANYFKEKLLAAAQAAQAAQLNNINNNDNINNNSNGNENDGTSLQKLTVNEDIDCVVESCTIVRRMNALMSNSEDNTSTEGSVSSGRREVIEIDEILPTNGKCNQLLVKLVKTKAPNEAPCKIIMATVDMDLEDERMEDNADFNSETVAAQLLLFDYVDSAISNEYNLAVTFSQAKCPQQLCILPSFQISEYDQNSLNTDFGALCVVCADGSMEIYSLADFQPITVIEEEGEHFVSVAYCRSLDRLCGCTRSGSLIFYSLNDAGNESGDEMLEMEEDCNAALATTSATIPGGSIFPHISDCSSNATWANTSLTVPDGLSKSVGGSVISTTTDSTTNVTEPLTSDGESIGNAPLLAVPNIKVDCGGQGSSNSPSGNGIINTNNLSQSSPSPSSSSINAPLTSNLLAYKTSALSLDDLRTLYELTQFDDVLALYTAEVPSCWNDLVQAQKQRKQPQHLRHGDDTQFTKTWRLHNDATTWDEHIIELNLVQPVSLGHIDLKFLLYQQCHNPAAIQVTLLKQNTSGFGYRMKGPHLNYKQATMDENIDLTFNNYDGTNENPVLSEEYLQTHNAEILAGPIELSSCIDLCDQGGTVTLTSPKLFKTRTRNFLLHIKTMSDPAKEGQSKTRVPVRKGGIMRLPLSSSFAGSATHNFMTNNTSSSNSSASTSSLPPSSSKSRFDFYIGCDWLHEISINVRGLKSQNRIPNERLQRIAMLDSNILLDNLFKIVSSADSTTLEKNLALDILTWICFIRLNRYRSPKSERIKAQINKNTASTNTDLMAQQFECICLSEKYLENMLRNCIIHSNRSMAHKCVKLILILTDGICSLPVEVQSHSTLDVAIKDAVANTFNELPRAKFASVVRWYAMLACATSTLESHNGISELCVKLLTEITQEIDGRWDPYCSLLSTRFGLYGFPFEPEIFDYDLPNVNKSNVALPSSLMNMIRSNAGLMQAAGLDIKKLCSIDGVDFRTFPHLIKCKSVSNQLRGLLEVEQLHYTCASTSEATRIDNMDTVSASSASNINMEELIVAPMVDMPKEQEGYNANDIVYNVDTQIKIINHKKSDNEAVVAEVLKPNGICKSLEFNPTNVTMIDDKIKFKCMPFLPKFKAICQYIEYCDESLQTSSANNNSSNTNNGTAHSSLQANSDPKINEASTKAITMAKQIIYEAAQQEEKFQQEQLQKQQEQQNQQEQDQLNTQPSQSQSQSQSSSVAQQQLPQKQPQALQNDKAETTTAAAATVTGSDNSNATTPNLFAWHKLLAPPPKQMVVIDRMHSGARRFVVLDFASPILLTDLVIPACDELASLHIDIWCFDEEADSVRLVVASDISTKTLVLSDLQPPPICRYMKITIIGRIGMSATKCKIPIGSFYGHAVALEHDAYGDSLLRFMKQPPQNIQTQIKALTSLYEDVHCRYSLASCKLIELLTPILNCEMSNVAHMQAFIHKQREDEANAVDNSKVVTIYEECILLQHQINIIRNVIGRLENSLQPVHHTPASSLANASLKNVLQLASRDKLRVLGQSLVEILLHFSIEYGIKNILPVHQLFTMDVANMLFNSLVVYGDAHIQLATCSLLVRMCCFQSWWGDFLADIFCNLFSSQNSKIFPQDRIFFLLTYLGRRSIAMGTCRSIVIDAVLKTLAKLLAPISPRYQESQMAASQMDDSDGSGGAGSGGLWSKSDLQLITWLLLFLSVCLDDSNDRKDKSSSRWDFMSCETDFTKTRTQTTNTSGKQLRCFKKRIVQQNKYSVQPYTDWGKKIFMIQNEHPGIFMEMTGKPKPSKTSKTNITPKATKESNQEPENNFDKGLKTIRLNNILIVIRGLIALLLEMDFTCNMDQFLLTCKVIARLVSACRPAVQLSKIITTVQLEQLIRLAVWNDQQQPWAVHAITCLLQDLLDADKHFKDNDTVPVNTEGVRPMEGIQETKALFSDYSHYMSQAMTSQLQSSGTDIIYADGTKYSYLPSLIECEDTEFDDILNDIDIIERSKTVTKKDSNAINKNTFNYFCKSISSAMDARLDIGLDINVEIQLRRLTMVSSLDMYASLPQILANEFITTPPEATVWPEYITDIWSSPEYSCGQNTYKMFKNVFDCIFAHLHLQDTWVHLEQVLQMWLTLNGELSDKPYNAGITQTDIPKIPFGAHAVQGLLLALAWHNDIKLRTWCLGFQCLFLACNSQALGDDDTDSTRINEVIVNDENFEKMLLRFFSGYGMSSSIITNRCAGPTICKHLHELLMWLHKKSESSSPAVASNRRKLKDTLLHVILQLVQPGGAIANQQGPIDAQSQLVRDLLLMPTEKPDLNVALNIIESVSFLVYNNISNGDKLQCQRSSDSHNASTTFSNLFVNVLGLENSRQNTTISDNSLIISLLKLSSALAETELPRQPSEVPIPEEEELSNESQTDETKAEQLNIEGHRPKTPCIADTVLRHFPTMKRLLGSLSHCSSSSFTVMASSSNFLLDEPQTTADAVFNLLITLYDKASNARLIVAPICQYLEASTIQRNSLPRLQLSEPFLWYISKVLEVSVAVQIFTQMGGIKIICQNLVRLNKILINMQPGLISLIMQHMTKNTKLKLHSHACLNGNGKKSSSSTSSAQGQRHFQDGLINFAPFCTISAEHDTAHSADILIMNPVASHRRPRTPAWSYMFYPNESHVDLTITLPTAILLKEVQLQPHAPTLASCPFAVALEISRDYGLGPIPVGPPLTTTGMTCIRLKLANPEIATSVVLRLYRPKDSANIGLSQIAILGNTIFAFNSNSLGNGASGSSSAGVGAYGTGGSGPFNSASSGAFGSEQSSDEDDTFAKTSVGWMRILARCFKAPSIIYDEKLAADVVGASAAYPGFLEACCSLMNIMPMIPNAALQNLHTVLLKLGAYNRNLCLSIIRILLWGTTPQTYKLSNESICNLLYELATTKDGYTVDKIQVLLEWIVKLRQNFSNRTLRCNNPQSGFVKCVASILWSVYTENHVSNLQDLITNDIFDACMHWIDTLENEEPLKVAFDSLLCSLCCIKPELFNQLLTRVNVKVQQTHEMGSSSASVNSAGAAQVPASDTGIGGGLTDDNKGQSGSAWFASVAAANLTTLLQRPAYLATLALACQSPSAVYQLVDSGLPKLLAYALYVYCSALLPEVKRSAPQATASTSATATTIHAVSPSTSASASAAVGQHTTSIQVTGPSSACLTDADKAECVDDNTLAMSDVIVPLLSCAHVPKVLDFFSECCAEGHMRDWLGTQQGAIFWKPLLELLCNYRPMEYAGEEPMQQAFIRMERATINFFTRVSACHPKNQDTLTTLLISVIRQPIQGPMNGKTTISGFTRQIVLQLLLENERILVSVRSKQPLQKRDTLSAATANTASNSSVSMSLVNHHPSKRINAHHFLFSVSANTKCQEILQNCVTVHTIKYSAMLIDTRTGEDVSKRTRSVSKTKNSELSGKHDSEKPNNDVYGGISLNFNGLENGMEFLSVAAGVTAKDKRIKDVKNQVAANKEQKEFFPIIPKYFTVEDFLSPANSSILCFSQLVHPDCPEVQFTNDTTIAQILATLHSKGHSLSTPCITLNIIPSKTAEENEEFVINAGDMEPLPSPLQRFSSRGGLSLLAQYLPTVYPDSTGRKTPTTLPEKEKSPPMTEWVKLEPNDEIYEDLEDPITEPTSKHTAITSVPQHSLAAFGLFLRLPPYSDVLLRDKVRAQCLLRLVLGVTGDGEGNDIYSLSVASSLPTLPFEVFRQLLDNSPLTTDDGMLLRRMVIEVGAMHLVLNCLGVFTHQSQNYQITSPQTESATSGIKTTTSNNVDDSLGTSDDKGHMYWAKGTGFGTGSTAQSWNVEQALLRQKSEEEHVTVLLQVLSSYINPGDKIPAALQSDEIMAYHEISEVSGELPALFLVLLQQSCLIPALSSYLRNDSVLDITRHIPLYRAILQLLRALSLSPELVSLLQPSANNGESSPAIAELLLNMKTCVDTYAKRLKVNKKSNIKGQTQQVTVSIDDGDDEGLALLIPDIQETTVLVQKTTNADALANQQRLDRESGGSSTANIERMPQNKSVEQRYLEVMKKLQFDTAEMIVEAENNGFRFVISHHFEKMVRMAGDRYHPSRVKRLAQEAVTLSTSLPLSYSSSVFVRCDTDRLDIMKVLITGPADTPYANGCFEFDVFFPPDYPNLPMMINLETTGRHSVRFNPNLYNDGKVCLSVLNTWHGRPEEKWNAQTSSFLQVLVSIQSLILVPEPYFNEPGFERSRGTPSGTHSSREYNSNIYQACVRWAMLEQIRNPSPCFRDVIHTHFWLKRNEICSQIENWIEELSKPQYSERNSRTISFNSMVLRRQYRHLREELAKLKVPEGLEDLDTPFNPNVNLPAMTESTSVNNGTNTTTATPVTSTASPSVIGSKSDSSANNNGNDNVNETENKAANVSSGSDNSAAPASTSSNSNTSNTVATQMSVPTISNTQPATGEIPNQPSAKTSESSSSASTTSLALTTFMRQSVPASMLVEVNNEFDDMSDATMIMPPQPPVPAPVTAKVTTVEVATTQAGEDGEADDEIQIDSSDYDYNADLVQVIFFGDDSQFENSKLGDFNE
ncbi:baculoviral IAP repeat-containing protein 6 isoform X3 [Anastrepha obliqua]|uniref:baculoviral IAP repeat-containing protein 6 isoform X3 n=1 Tax=Anastrepha obliqua TaxID=95512 RepID=UPI00240906C3|nr:baculoviral IAP repeat-containing protein 6 isoform X3 [Anastrepha obliqua]